MTDSPLSQDVARFLRYLGVERQLSPITLLNYQRQLDAIMQIADEIGLKSWQQCDAATVRGFVVRSRKKNLSPASLALSQKQFNTSQTMVVLFILPMWVNILIRTLATVALFDFLNLPLGEGALVFGMVYNFLPFMIYPIYNTLQKMDRSLIEAAQDLGANPLQVFGKVILPLSMPGIMSGIVMVFMPTVSTFAIAELLTMNNIKLFGTTVQENIYNGMWNYGAALSLIMLLLIGVTILFTNEEDGASNESGGVI